MTLLLAGALGVLGMSVLLVTARLVVGPSTLDRLVATDVLVILAVCVLVVLAALTGDSAVVPVAVATSLVGFLGSTAAARFLGRGGAPGQDGR